MMAKKETNANAVFAQEKHGFNRAQVNQYIEELTKTHLQAMAEKDNLCGSLKAQLEELKQKHSALEAQYQLLLNDKDKIAAALINAEATAQNIIAETQKTAEAEKQRLEAQAEDQRNLIVDRNKLLREMRFEICSLFDKFKKDLNDSYQEVIAAVESDLEKFMEASQKINDSYPSE